ncbi:putative hscarg dehydrogenase [Xylariomycetidae sp. FL2044]|nr:putative hscarg dehydrogenase [Xylariomycetidae sp. FL2044]
MSQLIVVTGVSGAQGGSVARTFLQLPEWRVRGISRDPSGKAAQALAAEGVEIVQGDFDDKESLVRAFQGANVIFANTDFFIHFISALNPENLPAGTTPSQYAYDREVEQGLNIAEAAETPSVLQTLDRFIMSSLSDAKKWSGGKYTTVYHYDSKAETIRQTHERCPGVAAKMSTVQVGMYVNNWQKFPGAEPQKQADGTFVLRRPFPPTVNVPHVVAHRDTGAFVKALVDMPAGKDIFAVSEWMTFPEWMEIWGRVLGVKAGYQQVTHEELFKAVPEEFKKEIGDSFDYIEEFGFTGNDPNVLDPKELGIKLSLTSMEEYIRSEDWSSVLNA